MEEELKYILKSRLGEEMSDFTIDAIISDLVKYINMEKRKSFEMGYANILTKK